MGLSTKQASAGTSDGVKVTDGVYANKKTIEKVKDLSGKNIEHIGKAFDLALEVQFQDDKFPVIFLGNIKTDASGEVTGWGGGFLVALLFTNVGEEAELNANNRFDPSALKLLIGKELYHVSYAAGTYKKDDGTKGNSYKQWNMTFPVLEDKEDVASMILEAWQKNRANGYPKDYELPKGTTSTSSVRGSGGSKAGKADVTESVDLTETDDMDDDLPF